MRTYQEMKTLVSIPGWAETFGSGTKLNDGSAAYASVPLVYRCTRLIADSLASVDLKVYKGKGKDRVEVDWPFDVDPVDWVWRTTSSILLMGASYSVRLTNKTGNKTLGLQWLNPLSVRPEVSQQTGEVIFKQTGNVAGGKTSQWGLNEMVYTREFNLADDLMPGISAAGVALTDAGLIRYLTRFASYYFEQGAMPLTILPIPVNTQADEVKRVERLFKSLATGIKRAFSVVAMRTGSDSGSPFTLTPPLKDLVMPALHNQSRQSIADAFGIPKTMLDDAANFATAAEHTTQFWTTCVRPRGNMITGPLNRTVFRPMGLECEFAYDELDVFQEDEANRADSLTKLKDAGLPLLMAMDILGYDIDEAQRAALEGMETIPPTPLDKGGNGSLDNGGNIQGASGKEYSADGMRSALYYWKKAALTAVGKGKVVDFDTLDIPEGPAEKIREALDGCKTGEDVHAVFKQAREWVKEPSPALPENGGTSSELVAELKRANDLLEKELLSA